eukprot:12197461-Karenia_brevis.AAC.1
MKTTKTRVSKHVKKSVTGNENRKPTQAYLPRFGIAVATAFHKDLVEKCESNDAGEPMERTNVKTIKTINDLDVKYDDSDHGDTATMRVEGDVEVLD